MTWILDPSQRRPGELRPLTAVPPTPNATLSQVGGTGDISQAAYQSDIAWASASDHTKTYGSSPNGRWAFGFNLFPSYVFPTQATYLAGFFGTIQSGIVSIAVDFLDSNSSVILTSYASVSYTINCTSPAAFDYSATLQSQVDDTRSIPAWNGVRVRSSCGNTNLNSLLNFGSFGAGASPTVLVYYPSSTVTRRARIG